LNNTKDKIKTSQELGIIFPHKSLRNKTVAICHGCYDLIHPGHIRYFDFAKRHADILVVSITADKHVNKGDNRPYIPEGLRMEQAAALQVVDYVCLSPTESASKILHDIKPDFYVKGIEYENSTGRALERLIEEREITEQYGGKLIYADDAVVMSSTKILSDGAQEVEHEKIRYLLKENGITLEYTLNEIEKFKDKKILVVGETIIDRYHKCEHVGCSSKDPIITINHKESKVYYGGAFVVANHFKRFCKHVKFITCASPEHSSKIISEYEDGQIDIINIEKTIIKDRFLGGKQKLLKVDYLENKELSPESREDLLFEFSDCCDDYDIIVFSDFGHGFLTSEVISELTSFAKEKFIVADCQDRMHDYGFANNIKKYHNIDLICPNEKEARISFGDSSSGITSLSRKILEETQDKFIILKMGENGLMSMERQENREDYQIYKNYITMNAIEKNPIDTVGCGDSVLCTAALSLATTNNICLTTILANLAGGIMSTKLGNELYTKEEFIDYLKKSKLWD